MKKNSLDGPMCWICDYWWVLLIIIVLIAVAYFTYPYWGPLLAS